MHPLKERDEYVAYKLITLPCIFFMFILIKLIHFSFLCDVCNEVHEHMQWLSELWWDRNIMVTSLEAHFQTSLFIGYSKRTSNYPKRITLSNSTHMMSMADHVAIGVETLRIDNGCSLEKEFIGWIRMNPWMVIYQTINQIDSCHICVCGRLTWDTKDILCMDDCVLIMSYESLATGSQKIYILDTEWSKINRKKMKKNKGAHASLVEILSFILFLSWWRALKRRSNYL